MNISDRLSQPIVVFDLCGGKKLDKKSFFINKAFLIGCKQGFAKTL
jgi:hypothetical protein